MKTYRYRSAITGRFVKEDYAKENPHTTVKVTIEIKEKDKTNAGIEQEKRNL